MDQDRVDLGFGAALDDLDLSDFKPRQTPTSRLGSGEASQAAEASGFRSREPKAIESPDNGAGGATPQRRRRTGRNVQFNLKVRQETVDTYCALADQMGWGLGETLEKAVELLEDQYREK